MPKTKERLQKDRRWWQFVSTARALCLPLTVMSIEYLGIKLSFLRGHTNTCDLRCYTLMTIFIPYSVGVIRSASPIPTNDNDNGNYNDIHHLWLLVHKYASFQLEFFLVNASGLKSNTIQFILKLHRLSWSKMKHLAGILYEKLIFNSIIEWQTVTIIIM